MTIATGKERETQNRKCPPRKEPERIRKEPERARKDQDLGAKFDHPPLGFWSARDESPSSLRMAAKNSRRDPSPAGMQYHRSASAHPTPTASGKAAEPSNEHERWSSTPAQAKPVKERRTASAEDKQATVARNGRTNVTIQRQNSRTGGRNAAEGTTTRSVTANGTSEGHARPTNSSVRAAPRQASSLTSLGGSRTSLSRRSSQERLGNGPSTYGARSGQHQEERRDVKPGGSVVEARREAARSVSKEATRVGLNRLRSSSSFGKRDTDFVKDKEQTTSGDKKVGLKKAASFGRIDQRPSTVTGVRTTSTVPGRVVRTDSKRNPQRQSSSVGRADPATAASVKTTVTADGDRRGASAGPAGGIKKDVKGEYVTILEIGDNKITTANGGSTYTRDEMEALDIR